MKINKILKILFGFVIALSLVLTGVYVVRQKKAELSRQTPPKTLPLAVTTDVVRSGELGERHRYIGTLKARVEVQVSPQIVGQITAVLVREGDIVKKGQILVMLDSRTQKAKIRSLTAQLQAAITSLKSYKATYERDLVLYRNRAMSREALDRSRTAFESARARVTELESLLRTARVELSYTKLAAPLDALVTRRFVEPGDTALPAKTVLTLEGIEEGYKLVVYVPQKIFPLLKAGMPVMIFPTARTEDSATKASISRLYPSTGSEQGALPVCEIDLQAKPFNLPSGSSLHVVIVVKKVFGFIIPARCLLRRPSSQAVVFTVDDDERIRPVVVKVLVTNPDFVCLEGDLTPGARVVTAGEDVLLRLYDGRKVYPVKTASIGS